MLVLRYHVYHVHNLSLAYKHANICQFALNTNTAVTDGNNISMGNLDWVTSLKGALV